MDIEEIARRSRSYRKFDPGVRVGSETLRWLVGLTRLAPSAANRQPLRYILSCSQAMNSKIFSTLTWASYLKDWPGPAEGERPAAYIVIALDRHVSFNGDIDAGIAAQTMLFGAVEKGLGGCILATFKKDQLEEILGLPDALSVLLVIALGKPAETVILEDITQSGSPLYYRDGSDRHHVPKRPISELIHAEYDGTREESDRLQEP
jgi:nitroreductase